MEKLTALTESLWDSEMWKRLSKDDQKRVYVWCSRFYALGKYDELPKILSNEISDTKAGDGTKWQMNQA